MDIVRNISSLETFDFVNALLNSIVSDVDLGLESLDHAHLSLKVLRNVIVVNDVSITLPLEHTKLRNRVVSVLVKVCNAQLRVSVLLSLHVDLQL